MTRSSSILRVVALPLLLATTATACSLPDLSAQEAPPPLAQNSVILDADGKVLTTLHAEEDRVVVPIQRIPRVMQDAVVAIEDQRFWTHRGVDVKALLRATYVNATEGRIAEGGSTITQQYAKNTLVGRDKTLNRKMREAAAAWGLERDLPKEEILAGYLNTIYFGKGTYGVQAAARKYFSKPASKIDLPDAALLAGLISAPEKFDPTEVPDAALARRNLVLRRMLEQGLIDRAAHDEAAESDLGLEPAPEKRRYPAPYFVQHVKDQILHSAQFGETSQDRYDFLFKGGLRIHTTIDMRMQKAAEKAVYGTLSERRDPHGALTAVDPRNGHIKAMVGGRDFFAKPKKDPVAQVNLATGAGGTGRQAGSSFKIYALVAALENGIPPRKVYPGGTSVTLNTGRGAPWRVRNYEGSGFGDIPLEDATIHSVNVVYARLIMEVGAKKVVNTAQRMGIRSKLRAVPSAVLGSNEVNTLEMASAYGSLANGGVHNEPIAIERITDPEGEVLWEAQPIEKEVLSPSVAWVTTQILRKVILRGTGTAANIRRPAAGKTGTAQQWRDAWFAGYIPQLSAAVWVGFPEGQISMVPPRTRARVTGGSFPAQIWQAFMLQATKGMAVENFAKPDETFVTVRVDLSRGCVVGAQATGVNVKTMTFVAGTEPERCGGGRVAAAAGSTVPSVVGMPVKAAVALLVDAGYPVGTTSEYQPYYPEGTVILQSPTAGSLVAAGTRVVLSVSTQKAPTVVVPDVRGLTENQAKNKLSNAGFAVAVHTAASFDPNVAPGRVVSQSPGQGSKAQHGATVKITINPSAPPSPSPSPT